MPRPEAAAKCARLDCGHDGDEHPLNSDGNYSCRKCGIQRCPNFQVERKNAVQLCPADGSQMENSGDSWRCLACGREDRHPTPPVENIPNLCRNTDCLHALDPDHDAIGCHVPGCLCTNNIRPIETPEDVFQRENAGEEQCEFCGARESADAPLTGFKALALCQKCLSEYKARREKAGLQNAASQKFKPGQRVKVDGEECSIAKDQDPGQGKDGSWHYGIVRRDGSKSSRSEKEIEVLNAGTDLCATCNKPRSIHDDTGKGRQGQGACSDFKYSDSSPFKALGNASGADLAKKLGVKSPKDLPFDQPNRLGCNECDDIRAPLNIEGYCKACASGHGDYLDNGMSGRQAPYSTFVFRGAAGTPAQEDFEVVAQDEPSAWDELAKEFQTSKNELMQLGIKIVSRRENKNSDSEANMNPERKNAEGQYWCKTCGKALTPAENDAHHAQGHQIELLPADKDRGNADASKSICSCDAGDSEKNPNEHDGRCAVYKSSFEKKNADEGGLAAFEAHAKACEPCLNAFEAGKLDGMCNAGAGLVKGEKAENKNSDPDESKWKDQSDYNADGGCKKCGWGAPGTGHSSGYHKDSCKVLAKERDRFEHLQGNERRNALPSAKAFAKTHGSFSDSVMIDDAAAEGARLFGGAA